jgi:hypothetical protein
VGPVVVTPTDKVNNGVPLLVMSGTGNVDSEVVVLRVSVVANVACEVNHVDALDIVDTRTSCWYTLNEVSDVPVKVGVARVVKNTDQFVPSKFIGPSATTDDGNAMSIHDVAFEEYLSEGPDVLDPIATQHWFPETPPYCTSYPPTEKPFVAVNQFDPEFIEY